jgi:signal transduction histidine kinase
MARQATARFIDGLSGRLRSALPSVVIDAPDEERGRRDRVVDATIYLVALAISAATLADTWQMHPPWLRVVAVVVGIATLVSLHWRRTHPAAVGIGIGAVSLVILPASGANLAATFNAAIRARGRDLAVIAGLLLAWAFASPLLYPPAGSYWVNAGACLLLTGVVLGWGLFVRARRELVRSLHEQADRAGDEARAAERRRIAREMHDVLAHRLSLLSVHAGALEFRPDASAEEVAEAAGVIREAARAALDELRGVIGVLREDRSETLTQPPQPTLADLGALVDESKAAGMRITARIELDDAAPPPAAVGRTGYRIAQEGLTNARKHAPGAAVTLTVGAPDGDLQVEVRSLAPVAVSAAPPLPGGGTGLIGLAERVTLAGGELEHGIDPEGAFVLRARLPR